MKIKLFASLALTIAVNTAKAQDHVVINEVMQSNIDYLMVDNDFPDSWVELYNPTEADIDLGSWYFGEKRTYSNCWQLPANQVIPAKGYFVIYCDKEAEGIHTDFRIDAGNAKLFLYDANGTAMDSLFLAEQPAANIAYGRKTDGGNEWQYEFAPSAGKANYGPGATEILPTPIFSIQGGLYAEPFTLTLSMPKGMPADALIFYTTNGQEPKPGQAGSKGGKSHQIEINKSTVVRAKIVSQSYTMLSGRSLTQSYIFHPREVTMPVISLVSDKDYFFSDENGIFARGKLVSELDQPNYMHKWRRPLNIEYYDTKGNQVLNQLGETAISGVSTRDKEQKSLKMYTNKRFGKKNFKSEIPFWEDKPEVKKMKSFVVRNGGNNAFTARINDAFIQKLFGTHVDNLDWQAYQPVIVYLNGEYLGEYGMRERSDDNYVEANYDGLEDIETADEDSYHTPTQGSLFEQFRNVYSTCSNYETLCQYMDMDNFVKNVAAEMYAYNTDFPYNNVSMWRPLEEGGKWRWILKDLDRYGQNNANSPMDKDMATYLFSPDDLAYAGLQFDCFRLYANMAKIPEFRDQLVKTLAVYLGDFLRPDVAMALYEKLDAEIEAEYKATLKNYGQPVETYYSGRNFMRNTISARANHVYNHLNDYFKLGGLVPTKVINNDSIEVTMNGIRLTEGDFNGKYFMNQDLQLSTGREGWGWKITSNTLGNVTETTIETSELSMENLLEYAPSTSATLTFTPYCFNAGEGDDEGDDEGGNKGDDDPADKVASVVTKALCKNGKYLQNNRIVIYRNGKQYNVWGAELKQQFTKSQTPVGVIPQGG